MLIDDDYDQLHLLGSALKCNGFKVFTVNDPSLTVQIVQRNKPDLILADIRLGEYDGREICYQLKTIASIPIILYQPIMSWKKVLLNGELMTFYPNHFMPSSYSAPFISN